jgi:hypothetical protein
MIYIPLASLVFLNSLPLEFVAVMLAPDIIDPADASVIMPAIAPPPGCDVGVGVGVGVAVSVGVGVGVGVAVSVGVGVGVGVGVSVFTKEKFTGIGDGGP